MTETQKGIAFLCLTFAFVIVSFLVTQRIVPDWFIPIDLVLAFAVVLISIHLVVERSNRTKK
jgi:hypothetical protein